MSVNLVTLITDVYRQAIVEDNEQENGEEQEMLDVELALQSAEYKKYLNACQELQCVDILNLSRSQKVAFFLNVY